MIYTRFVKFIGENFIFKFFPMHMLLTVLSIVLPGCWRYSNHSLHLGRMKLGLQDKNKHTISQGKSSAKSVQLSNTTQTNGLNKSTYLSTHKNKKLKLIKLMSDKPKKSIFEHDITKGAQILRSLKKIIRAEHHGIGIISSDYYLKPSHDFTKKKWLYHKDEQYTYTLNCVLWTMTELIPLKITSQSFDKTLTRGMEKAILNSLKRMHHDKVNNHEYNMIIFPLYLLDEIAQNKAEFKQDDLNSVLKLQTLHRFKNFQGTIKSLRDIRFPSMRKFSKSLPQISYVASGNKSQSVLNKYREKKITAFTRVLKEHLSEQDNHSLMYWDFLQKVIANHRQHIIGNSITETIVKLQKKEKLKNNTYTYPYKSGRSYTACSKCRNNLNDVVGFDATDIGTRTQSKEYVNSILTYIINYTIKTYDVSFLPLVCTIVTNETKWDFHTKRTTASKGGFLPLTSMAKKNLKKYFPQKWNKENLKKINTNIAIAIQAGIDFVYILEKYFVTLQDIDGTMPDTPGIVDTFESQFIYKMYHLGKALPRGYFKNIDPMIVRSEKMEIAHNKNLSYAEKSNQYYVKSSVCVEELFNSLNFGRYPDGFKLGVVNDLAGMVFSIEGKVFSIIPGIITDIADNYVTVTTHKGNKITYTGDSFQSDIDLKRGNYISYRTKLGITKTLCISAQLHFFSVPGSPSHKKQTTTISLVPTYEFSRVFMNLYPYKAGKTYAKFGKGYRIQSHYNCDVDVIKKRFTLTGVSNIYCEFALRKHPVKGLYQFHSGIDVNIYDGIIRAIGNGVVEKISYESSGAGHYMLINHENDYRSSYMHLKHKPQLAIGETVVFQSEIGIQGASGLTTGNHLHLGIEENINYGADRKINPIWVYVNPRKWISIVKPTPLIVNN